LLAGITPAVSPVPTKSTTNLYHVHLKTDSEMLGTAPSSPDIYSDFIVSKKFEQARDLAKQGKLTESEIQTFKDEEAALTKQELTTLPPEDSVEKGTTVFRRIPAGQPNAGALMLPDFMIRGGLKEAASACGYIDKKGEVSTWGLSGKIDKFLFVCDASRKPLRYIPLMRDGQPIMAPDSIFSRPLRAMTAAGPRVTLASSEQILAGAELDFYLFVMPLGIDLKFGRLTPEGTRKLWRNILSSPVRE
jgi:hypothetical protein